MFGKALESIVERFNFDDSKLIFVARQGLQSLVDCKVARPQKGLNLDHSTKSLLDPSMSMRSLDLTDVEFDEFMNSFEIEYDKTSPMSTKDDATSFTPAVRNIVPTNPIGPMPKAANHQSAAAVPPPLPPVTLTRPASGNEMPMKPLRPLTAYHTYLQIEREFIIQTMAENVVFPNHNFTISRTT